MSIKSNRTKNKAPLEAKYSNRVIAFAPLKLQERKSLSGSIGEALWASDQTNKKSTSTPPASRPSIARLDHDGEEIIVKPYASRPSPATASRPPRQSTPTVASSLL